LDANSAGEGKGSVIMYNGRPMRITLFNSDKTDGGLLGSDQRSDTIKGTYLDGKAEEVTIYSSGKYDL